MYGNIDTSRSSSDRKKAIPRATVKPHSLATGSPIPITVINSDLPLHLNTTESDDRPYKDISPLPNTPHLEFAGDQELYTNNDKEVERAKQDHLHQLYTAHAHLDEEGYAAPVNMKDLARKQKKEKLALARTATKRASSANESNRIDMTWSELKSMTEMGTKQESTAINSNSFDQAWSELNSMTEMGETKSSIPQLTASTSASRRSSAVPLSRKLLWVCAIVVLLCAAGVAVYALFNYLDLQHKNSDVSESLAASSTSFGNMDRALNNSIIAAVSVAEAALLSSMMVVNATIDAKVGTFHFLELLVFFFYW